MVGVHLQTDIGDHLHVIRMRPLRRLLLHDPSVYKEPHEFNPGRFMTTKSRSAERDPHEIVFGFGRRTCPGRHVADASIFMSVASILATLEVRKVVENGKVIDPVIEPSSGGIRCVNRTNFS